jgi:glutamyl-tRNA reductase
MSSNVFVAGVNHHSAPLELREEISLTQDQARELLPSLASGDGIEEVLLLSTCARTELYGYGDPHSGVLALMDALRRARPDAKALDGGNYRFVETGDAAIHHLFRVTAGIDSQILGDTNIVAQVKQALSVAQEAGTHGPFLARAVTEALRAGKRARRETCIGQGSASIGGAVLKAIRRQFANSGALRVLLLGAGEAGRDIAHHLAKADLGQRIFSTRNFERAVGMAREFKGQALDWSQAPNYLRETDVLITATAARLGFLDRGCIETAAAGQELMIIDSGNPRNVDPSLAKITGVRILDLEALSQEQEETLMARRREIPRVEAILEQDLERWRRWRERRIPGKLDG